MQLSEEKRRAFREDGAVRLEGLLDEHWLSVCREKFEWSLERRSPTATDTAFGTGNIRNDLTSLGSEFEAEKREAFRGLVTDGPFAQAAAQLWGSDKVWYYDHETFVKRHDGRDPKTGKIGRTRSPFHQDTPYFNFVGPHTIGFWVCLDGYVPKENCLQIVKGSHLGQMYDLTIYHPADDTRGLFRNKGSYPLPPLPDIEGMIKRGEPPELVSWELNSGDVLAFHLNSLHGGGGTSPEYPNRRTMTIRFFGDGATYQKPPMGPEKLGYGPPRPWLDDLPDGAPFSQSGAGQQFLQVWPAPAPAAASPTAKL